jgi:hypothetical protein
MCLSHRGRQGDDATGTPRTRQIDDFSSITSIEGLSITVITLRGKGNTDNSFGWWVVVRGGNWRTEQLAELKGERVLLGSTVLQIMREVTTAIEVTNFRTAPYRTGSTAPLPP